jgi:NhaA family Na+:H+ antiporter
VGAKLFLLALAIADDIGAIAVIAVFYTSDLNVTWLLAAVAMLGVVYLARRVNIRSILFYVVTGVIVWFFVFESGVHATLAGVALGLMTPAVAYVSDNDFQQRSRWILDRFDMDSASPRARERIDADALEMSMIAKESVPPLDRLERALHPWSSFVVVPLFALANAGVRFANLDVVEAVTSSVSLGVMFGLVIGKLVGITGFTWLAVRLGLGVLPRRTGWRDLFGLGALAGIGFTVSLFITELAFTDELLSDAAKLGIFSGSLTAGILGYTLLRLSPTPQEEIAASRERLGLDDYAYAEEQDTIPAQD